MNILLLALLLAQGLTGSQADKGILTGQVRSLSGQPVGGVRVAAMAVGETGVPDGTILASLTQTDAAGNYRLENVPPGRYYIMAGLIDFPSYFPGVSNIAEATVVTVAASARVSGMDFTLARGVNVRVQGRVTGLPAGFRSQISRITLMPRSGGVRPDSRQFSTVKEDGTFEISNVSPGTYSVMVSIPNTALRQPATIVVGESDLTDVVLSVMNPETVTRQEGLEQSWSVVGLWTSVAPDEKTGLLYASGFRSIDAIDHTGKTSQITFVSTPTGILRVAHFSEDESPYFLAAVTRQVLAYDSKGTALWSYPPTATTAIDAVWAADLDGDKLDEVIVGFNGGTGLHVLNSKGQLVWKTESIGNVWHVTAGKLRGEGLPQVVTTSARGQVHVFSADGTSRDDLIPGLYANMVRVSSSTIVALGSSLVQRASAPPTSLLAAGLSVDGVKKWGLELSAVTPFVHTAEVAPGKPWLAVGIRDGQVYVIDTDHGAIIARIDGQGPGPTVGWMIHKETGAPMLVVSTRTRINAYTITIQ